MQLFLRGLYYCLKALVRLSRKVFYPFVHIAGREHLRFQGPAIVISNHPNTLFDPLNIGVSTPRQLFFLANAGLFKHPVSGFLLRYLYCIPIARPGRDTGSKVNNKASFQASYDHLASGGVIYIAAEGISELGRRLRPFKTGAARIALGAEAANNWQLGIQFILNGLTYEHPRYCGSRLHHDVAPPVLAADWRAAYDADPVQAVRDLTDHLEAVSRTLLVHTNDEEEDRLLHQLDQIHQHDKALSVADYYERSQLLLTQLRALPMATYESLVTKANTYFAALSESGLTDRGLAYRDKPLLSLWTILGWPVWLYGRVNNFVAFEIPRWVVRKTDFYPGYDSAVKALSGLFSFPIAYLLQYFLVKAIIGTSLAYWYLISVPVSGVLAWLYARYTRPRMEGEQWRRWAKQFPDQAADLLAQRKQLTVELSN